MNYTFQLRGPKPVASQLVTIQSSSQIPVQELDLVLLRENIKEYDRIVDDIVLRAKEQDGIVKEWDREIEKQRDMQYRLMFDDVIREVQFLIHCASIRI